MIEAVNRVTGIWKIDCFLLFNVISYVFDFYVVLLDSIISSLLNSVILTFAFFFFQCCVYVTLCPPVFTYGMPRVFFLRSFRNQLSSS